MKRSIRSCRLALAVSVALGGGSAVAAPAAAATQSKASASADAAPAIFSKDYKPASTKPDLVYQDDPRVNVAGQLVAAIKAHPKAADKLQPLVVTDATFFQTPALQNVKAFKDGREWVVDKNLDALHVVAGHWSGTLHEDWDTVQSWLQSPGMTPAAATTILKHVQVGQVDLNSFAAMTVQKLKVDSQVKAALGTDNAADVFERIGGKVKKTHDGKDRQVAIVTDSPTGDEPGTQLYVVSDRLNVEQSVDSEKDAAKYLKRCKAGLYTQAGVKVRYVASGYGLYNIQSTETDFLKKYFH